MDQQQLHTAYQAIDKSNSKDPNLEVIDGKSIAKELIYGQRMTDVIESFDPNASTALLLAARAQHICRWEIPRSNYEMNRVGYLTWRNDLKKFHAETVGKILEDLHFETETIDRVSFLIQKKKLKKDIETQTLEDVICLVFLKYYYEAFSKKHTKEKVIDIIQKTWKKMSNKGHDAALKLNYTEQGLSLIQRALSE